MLITRETDYAVRCVSYLACRPGEVVMANEIARQMHIPKTFLAKILQKLSKAGLVESFRGIKGGFRLARKPGETTVYDVIVAVDGPPRINLCAVDERLCGLAPTCSIHPIWVEIRKSIEDRLKKADFATLTKKR